MTFDPAAARKQLSGRIHALVRPGDRSKLRAYLGSPVRVLGLRAAESRAVRAEFARTHPDLTEAQVDALAAALWARQTVEEKWAAIGLLSGYADRLGDASWRLADSWVDAATGWALSDTLASGPIATMLRAKPARFQEVLRWTRSKNFWRRRASTYALNDFVRAGELDRPFRLLERLLHDEEFWVQRAVGTWLRECGKKDRRCTEAFLRAHAQGLPPVTITVATERSTEAFREALRRKAKAGGNARRRKK